MKIIRGVVGKRSLRFQPDALTVLKDDEIEVRIRWANPSTSLIHRVSFSGFTLLKYNSDRKLRRWEEDTQATSAWNDERTGIPLVFNRPGPKGSNTIVRTIGARKNDGKRTHRLVKFWVTLTDNNGIKMRIDPIWDERP